MKVISIQSQINDVAERWEKQHPPLPPDAGILKMAEGRRLIAHYRHIGERLAQLDTATATQKDVADIIGDSSWVEPPTCYECGGETGVLVQVLDEPNEDYDYYWKPPPGLCLHCLKAAVTLAEKAEKQVAQKGLEQPSATAMTASQWAKTHRTC